MDKQAVYDFLTRIPAGKVVTYGQIARYLGNRHLARAVGNILHRNPDPDNIPCHRVLGAGGALTGFGGGMDAKRFLLELESIPYREA